MRLAKCNICEREMSLRGIKGHIRFSHPTEDESNFTEIEPQPEPEEIKEKEFKFDKQIETKSDIVKTLREQYEILNYQNMIRQLTNPQPAQQTVSSGFSPSDMMSLFTSMLGAFQNISNQQKQTSLVDELEKVRILKDLAGEISSEQPEDSGFKDIFKLLLASELQKKPQEPIPIQPIKPTETPILNQSKVEKESEIMDLSELLTPEAKKQIGSMNKEVAWNFIRKFFAISKEEFEEIYKKCKEVKY